MQLREELTEGQRVGNYILKDKIGQGAFAEVWRSVHHERPGRLVALKIATAPAFQRQLGREGRLPDIDHPNVVPILDSDTRFAKIPYIVMPYMSGGNLADLITQHPDGLPEERVEQLLHDILGGLGEAHRRNIVHRDIKPQNTLLDESGRAHIADFGLSLSNAAPDGLRSMIQSASLDLENDQAVAGTLAYMAPEVLEGQPATPAADVYAVGILLFEMLAGRRPVGVELPSTRRKNLGRAAWWDAIFYWAFRPLTERYSDAMKMPEALENGPKPVPFAGPVAAPILALPQPAPLPDDQWDALAVRWQERKRILDVFSTHRARIKDALRIYAEHHRVVQGLRAEERRIESEVEAATSRMQEIARRLARWADERRSPLVQRRDELLAEGCLPSHPDAKEIDRKLEPYHILAFRLRSLDEAGNRLVRSLRNWLRAHQEDSRKAYEHFLEVERLATLEERSGQQTVLSPFAGLAKTQIRAIRRRSRRRALFAAAVLVVATVAALFVASKVAQARRARAAEHLEEARSALAAGDQDGALDRYCRAIRLNPNLFDAYIERGKIYAQRHSYRAAIEDFTHAAEITPNDARAYFSRAVCYHIENEELLSVEDCTRAIELEPDHRLAYGLRGWLDLALGRVDSAVRDLTRAIELGFDEGEMYQSRARAYLEKGDFDQAIEDCRQAIRRGADDARTHFICGQAHYKKGDHYQAIAHFDEAIRHDPDSARLYLVRGAAYSECKQNRVAREDFKKAIALDRDGDTANRAREWMEDLNSNP
ncbi:MAG: tetratricopeptide repeat protein [Phycisphaerae bacterium]